MPGDQEKLKRLQDELYKKDPAGTSYEPHDLQREQVDNIKADWQPATPEPPKEHHEWHLSEDDTLDKWLKRLFALGAIIFLIALGFAAFRFILGLNVVDDRKVDLSVEGPVSIKGGDTLELDIEVKNNNEIALESAKLIMEYPPGTRSAEDIQTEVTRHVETLGVIPEGESIQSIQKAVLFGEKDSVKDIVVRVEYRVEGSNATFTKEETYQVKITSSPLILTVDYPEDVNSGQEIDFTLTVASNASQPIEDLLVRGEYPFGFEFRDASPEPRFGESVWRVGTLEPGEKEVIHVKGRIAGQENDERTFRFYAGEASVDDERDIGVEYISTQNTLTIRKPFVALTLSLGGNTGRTHSIPMGKRTQVDIRWNSNLESTLDDAEVVVKLRGDALDKQQVSVGSGGFYRSVDNTITWTKNNNPDLTQINPGDRGSVSFSFATVSPSPTVISQFNNAQIDIEVELKGRRFDEEGGAAEDITSELEGIVKVNADLSLVSRGLYADGPFSNSGPMPPESESETTYTVEWEVTNAFNDVENVEVRASLPSYVTWKGQTNPSSEDITFVEDTREVVWKPGYVNAGAGFLSPAKKVAFQIGFFPSQGQIGSIPVLVNNIRTTGRDLFTDTVINFDRSDITTDIKTDSGFDRGDERVR